VARRQRRQDYLVELPSGEQISDSSEGIGVTDLAIGRYTLLADPVHLGLQSSSGSWKRLLICCRQAWQTPAHSSAEGLDEAGRRCRRHEDIELARSSRWSLPDLRVQAAGAARNDRAHFPDRRGVAVDDRGDSGLTAGGRVFGVILAWLGGNAARQGQRRDGSYRRPTSPPAPRTTLVASIASARPADQTSDMQPTRRVVHELPSLFSTSVVGSYVRPDWLIDRARLAGRFPPRVRAAAGLLHAEIGV
jgi:hypothetical protein